MPEFNQKQRRSVAQANNYPAIFFASISLLAGLLIASQSQAAIITTELAGTLANSNNGCTAEVILNGDDCSYNGSDPVSGTSLEWIGPVFQSGYYTAGGAPGADVTPTSGDGKTALAMTGSFSIANNDDGFGANDLVSFTLTLAPGVENADAGLGSRIQYSWSSITWTMAFTLVDSVTANGLGGFDYVIGSAGIPSLLTDAATGTDSFTSETASTSTLGLDGSYWSGPASTGVTSFEGNLGGAPGVSATGWACDAGADGADCAGRSVATEQFWNNLLIVFSTDAAGNVITAEGLGVAERDMNLLLPGVDSWDADSFSLAIVPLPAAAWMFVGALGWLGLFRRKLS